MGDLMAVVMGGAVLLVVLTVGFFLMGTFNNTVMAEVNITSSSPYYESVSQFASFTPTIITIGLVSVVLVTGGIILTMFNGMLSDAPDESIPVPLPTPQPKRIAVVVIDYEEIEFCKCEFCGSIDKPLIEVRANKHCPHCGAPYRVCDENIIKIRREVGSHTEYR